MDYMNHTGETVFLDVSPEVLFRRLKIAKAKRPLLANKTDEELMQVITSALEKRLPYYTKAKWRFNAEELESYAQIDRAVNRLKNLIN